MGIIVCCEKLPWGQGREPRSQGAHFETSGVLGSCSPRRIFATCSRTWAQVEASEQWFGRGDKLVTEQEMLA